MNECTVPGKLFLMGEYGVIEGGQALLAAIKPGFTYSIGSKDAHPESPLGAYSKQFAMSARVELKSEQSLAPGFGTSTAELVAALVLTEKLSTEKLSTEKFSQASPELWKWYRKQFPKTSGADLLVQLEALRSSEGFFRVSEKSNIETLPSSKLFEQIFVFQTHRKDKLATHEALNAKLPELLPDVFNQKTQKLESALLMNEERGLKTFTEFAELLAFLGLESAHARAVRLEFSKLPITLGVKGCGAGLHDVFLVGVDRESLVPARRQNALQTLSEVAGKFRLKSLGALSECLW